MVEIYNFLVAFVLTLDFVTSKVFIDVQAQDCLMKTPNARVANGDFFASPQCPKSHDMMQTLYKKEFQAPYSKYNLVSGWKTNVYDPSGPFLANDGRIKNVRDLDTSSETQETLPVASGNFLYAEGITPSKRGGPQYVCETITICEATDPELYAVKERLQSMENSIAQLRRSAKANKVWQRKHDETTENLQVSQNTLAVESQQQGTLLFFAVTIALLVVLFIVYYVLHLVFPDLWYKTALTCSSLLVNTSRKVQVALDKQRRKLMRAYAAYRNPDDRDAGDENRPENPGVQTSLLDDTNLSGDAYD
jgi:hypothetical protein